MINIAVCGANGKMGQEVVKAVNAAEDMTLVAQIDIFNGQFATIKDANDSVKIDVLIGTHDLISQDVTLPSRLPYTKMHFIVSITRLKL